MTAWQKTLVWCAAAAAGGSCTTLGGWQILKPVDSTPRVAFAELMNAVEAGKVMDVHVDGTEYAFTLRGDDRRAVREIATGPKADIALVRALRPTDAQVPPPHVYFER